MRLTLLLAAAAAMLMSAPSALAISNGVPDGNAHPNVGLLASGDDRSAECSGFYAGPRDDSSGQAIFMTAGHCVADIAARTIDPDDLWVTFDSSVLIDPEDDFRATADSWVRGASEPYALDPGFGGRRSDLRDWGVIVLEHAPPGIAPVELPTARLLDELAASGDLGPDTRFDNVGYGVEPTRTGPFGFTFPMHRMRSVSRFQSLTPSYLQLLGNSALGADIGGSCLGDSGGPKFIHSTNVAVAVQSGGDARCRAYGYSQRLDTPAARAFLGQYLVLP